MGKRSRDPGQGILEFQSPTEIALKFVEPKPVSLVERIQAESDGIASAQTPINNSLDYHINRDTLVTLRSKVRRVGGARPLSFEDHFNLSKNIFNGIYAIESHNFGNLTSRYGVPHELLINLTPSEILSFYMSVGEFKKRFKPGIDAEQRYSVLTKSKPFEQLVKELADKGQNYNAICVMRRKEGTGITIPDLVKRLSKISQKSREEVYRALSHPSAEVRQPYRKAPGHMEDVEGFYIGGIDTYSGKIATIFHELYQMKNAKRAA